MSTKTKLTAALTAAALTLTVSPMTAHPEYTAKHSQSFSTEDMEQLSHYGLFGDGSLLFREKSDEPWYAQRTDKGYLAAAENDKYYVRGYFWNDSGDTAAGELRSIFGEGAAVTLEHLQPEVSGNGEAVADVLPYCMLTVTDPDITYSEVIAANAYCKSLDTPDNTDCGDLDYYYAPERCPVYEVPLWIKTFSVTLSAGTTYAELNEYLSSFTDLIWRFNMTPDETGVLTGTVWSSWSDASPEMMYKDLAEIKTKTGIVFSGDRDPVPTGKVLYQDIDAGYFKKQSYTYNDLSAMTDGEVRALYPGFFAGQYDGTPYDASAFGDETMTDYEKFARYFGNFEWGGGDLADYSLDGTRNYYLTYTVSTEHDIKDGFTAGDFGFPADWAFSADRGYFTHLSAPDTDPDDWYYSYGNEYRISVPAETAEDFESFIRLVLCTKSCPDENVIHVAGAEEFFITILYEPMPSFPLGDVNLDFTVSMADAVRIMRANADPDGYGLNEVLLRRVGDADGVPGVTNGDALAIQKYLYSGLTYKYPLTPPFGAESTN
ncbi:MAG: hypothetical protein IJM44_04195 [Ruminococcus sp.]|nr:hypothetical protein [Ruminococcus sp.]